MAGPDGNLWFSEHDANIIANISTAGVLTPYSAPTVPSGLDGIAVITEFGTGMSAGAQPNTLVAGSDGNIYFSEENGNRIGRISMSGTIMEITLSNVANAGPIGITTAPDGNLWFTESTPGRIGHITY